MANEVKAPKIDSSYKSDSQRASDLTGLKDDSGYNPSGDRDLTDRAADKADSFADKAKDAGDSFMDKASDIGHSMQDQGHNIAEKSKKSHQAICKFTKENPTTAVLMAFGLGAILARVLPGR